VGSQSTDVREFLEAYAADGYKVDDFRLSKCVCGSDRFFLWADDDEGCAKRECTSCKRTHFICDSEEYWTEAKPERWKCAVCKSKDKACNIGVGFSLYEDGEVRWLYIGERCANCGVLGCFAGWKVAYSPSRQLLDQC
jgi:hypothetical protein